MFCELFNLSFFFFIVTQMLRLSKRTIQTQETTETFQHQIWFSNLFPIKRKYFDLRKPFIKPYASFIALQCRNKLIPSTLSPSSWVAAPNTKEGGLFFKFNFDGNPSDFLDQVNSHLSEKNVSSIWNFQQIQAYSVKGSPFLEDMYGHLPDNRLKIEFEGPDIHMETLYSIFRQYGKIHDISILSLSSKELPRFATIRFYKLRDACSARNCLHGKLVDKTRLSVHYEKPENEGWFWKWVQAHPRISVPILIALIAATSYLVFDPLRSWFITNKISNRFSFETYYKKIQSWFIGSMERMPRFIQSGLGYHSLETHDHFSERKSQQSKLVSTLKESVGTLTLIQGPKAFLFNNREVVKRIWLTLRYLQLKTN